MGRGTAGWLGAGVLSCVALGAWFLIQARERDTPERGVPMSIRPREIDPIGLDAPPLARAESRRELQLDPGTGPFLERFARCSVEELEASEARLLEECRGERDRLVETLRSSGHFEEVDVNSSVSVFERDGESGVERLAFGEEVSDSARGPRLRLYWVTEQVAPRWTQLALELAAVRAERGRRSDP